MAAALAGKAVVGCETFTCLYGFPARHLGEAEFEALLLGSSRLEAKAPEAVLRLAGRGPHVALTRRLRRPGRGPKGDYGARVEALAALPNVRTGLGDLGLTPLVEAEGGACRRTGRGSTARS